MVCKADKQSFKTVWVNLGRSTGCEDVAERGGAVGSRGLKYQHGHGEGMGVCGVINVWMEVTIVA